MNPGLHGKVYISSHLFHQVLRGNLPLKVLNQEEEELLLENIDAY